MRLFTSASLPVWLTLVLLVPMLAEASPGREDVIYFKNGAILRGEIIEINENISLKIETAGRNVMVVMMDEVLEIKRERIPEQRNFRESGYMNLTGIDVLYGRQEISLRFHMVNGYQFTTRLSAGIGFGFIPYNDPLNLMPLYLDTKFKLIEANTTPFVFFKGGYSFSVLPDDDISIEEHNGGLMINPGIGIQFDNNSGYGWYFQAGYNLDRSNFDQRRWDNNLVENSIEYRRFLFGFGLTF